MTKPALYAGTSGWAYPLWKPGFYPASVPARKFLEHYASRLNSVEVNYTFRSSVSEKQLSGWINAVPEDFHFTFKAPGEITHMRRLRACDQLLADFLASLTPVVNAEKQGAILLQFPPNFRAAAAGKDKRQNSHVFEDFLQLTREIREASKWNFAVEFRDASWFNEEVYRALQANNIALCLAQSDELNTPQIQTADFSYARLRATNYTASELESVFREQAHWAADRTAYAYFKHEDAPDGALRAEQLLRRSDREQNA